MKIMLILQTNLNKSYFALDKYLYICIIVINKENDTRIVNQIFLVSLGLESYINLSMTSI